MSLLLLTPLLLRSRDGRGVTCTHFAQPASDSADPAHPGGKASSYGRPYRGPNVCHLAARSRWSRFKATCADRHTAHPLCFSAATDMGALLCHLAESTAERRKPELAACPWREPWRIAALGQTAHLGPSSNTVPTVPANGNAEFINSGGNQQHQRRVLLYHAHAP